ncbi:MAG: alkaline phosphatase family protein [Tepidisphaeraceae bacterium]
MRDLKLSRRMCCAVLAAAWWAGQAWADAPAAPFDDLLAKRVLFNGWGISPVGTHVPAGSMCYAMAFTSDGQRLLATSAGVKPGLAVIDPATKKQVSFIPLPRAMNGLCVDGENVFVTGGNSDSIHVLAADAGDVKLSKSIAVNAGPEIRKNVAGEETVLDFLTGLAKHPAKDELYVCNEGKNEVWVVDEKVLLAADAKTPKSVVTKRIRVGERPYACAFGADKRHLYVTNWGGRSVSVIDTDSGDVVQTVNVGIRPNALTLGPDGRLFVACAGDNSVYVLQTRALQAGPKDTGPAAPPDESALEVISTALYPQSPEGSTPLGVSVSPDGKLLYVVNADNNDVAVVDLMDAKLSKVVGFIPTGWYPAAVLATKDGVAVANGKGLSSRESYPPRNEAGGRVGGTRFDNQTRILEGSVSFIDGITPETLATHTKQVRKNSPYTPQTLRSAAKAPDGSPIPSRVGGESPIKHVVYVIKENRTYDQVMGDFVDATGKPAGNGEPKLTLFGERITPNQHQLARDYVLLDNFYCNGEVSVDGHSWCDGAIATDANQKSWTTSYTQHGKLPMGKDLSTPAAGYIWNLCQRNGVSYKCYGEGAKDVPSENRGTWSDGRDPEKVEAFLKDLAASEQSGEWPGFMILSLGENHTRGTTPGAFTPAAMVASNDQAVGQLVEGISKSKFWDSTAIFIVEDDAQNGPDHVDSHRTVGLVISPYVKRGVVDSTPYTQVSMLRTMELILGLPPLTQYDAAATPMYGCFMAKPQLVAFACKPAQIDLAAKNAPNAPGAKASAEMDFDEFDEAPEDELNRILWLAMKGPDVPYPTPVRRAVLGTEVEQE